MPGRDLMADARLSAILAPMSDRIVQALLTTCSGGGVALAWVLHDWLDNCWDHCDDDGAECLTEWFPLAFGVSQYLWVSVVFLAVVTAITTVLAGWPRRDSASVLVATVVLFLSLGITPLHGGGQPLTNEQVERNPFLWDSHGYSYVALVVLGASFTFAVVLAGSVRRQRSDRSSSESVGVPSGR